ncbi:MAG: thiamine pyrophosphate-dependent enzyme [Gammaproteobacteria bacterium]
MMKRDACLKVLARHYTDQIVVAVYQAAFEWRHIRPDALTYVAVGAMGQASSHALGLALGRPDKQIIVLDGDGSLLMNLGTLVTVASVAPANLVHCVCENGTYEANGAHPTPGSGQIDFAGLASAAGYDKTFTFDSLDDFDARIDSVLTQSGPVFVDLKVEPGETYPQDYKWVHSAEVRQSFKERLRKN